MLLPSASSFGDWKANDIKEWGNISRKTIKELVTNQVSLN
jgi:hypothetical protein